MTFIGLAIALFRAHAAAQQLPSRFPADSATSRIFRISLAEEFAYRALPSLKENTGSGEVFILDSNIVKNDLPGIPKGKLIPISIGEVDSLVRRGNEITYIFLASLKLDSGVARVKWNWMTAVFSRRYQMVMHLARRSDEGSYRLTRSGWVGGMTRTVMYGLEPPD